MRRSQLTATLPLFFSLALIAGQTLAADFTGRVVGVADGDTITVLHSGKPVRIRLNGIDSPEKRQAFGKRAKQFTSRLTYGKAVTVKDLGQDRYGRTIGDVILPDGRVLNQELVKAGFAWWYRRYAPDDEILKQLEHEARGAKRGLWADPHAVPPWEWRGRRSKSYCLRNWDAGSAGTSCDSGDV